MYVGRNIGARSCNHCCSEKAISTIYIFCECVRGLSYPACNAHAPHYHMWPARLQNMFPYYLTKGTFLGKKGC